MCFPDLIEWPSQRWIFGKPQRMDKGFYFGGVFKGTDGNPAALGDVFVPPEVARVICEPADMTLPEPEKLSLLSAMFESAAIHGHGDGDSFVTTFSVPDWLRSPSSHSASESGMDPAPRSQRT